MRDVTMIDVDCDDPAQVSEFRARYLEWLIAQCEQHPEWRFVIYLSRRGLHVFPLHKVMQGDERAQFQLDLQCDFYYIMYTYVRQGSCIRLNRKKDDADPLYRFVGYLGTGTTDPRLDDLVKFHFDLQFCFQHVGLSEMR